MTIERIRGICLIFVVITVCLLALVSSSGVFFGFFNVIQILLVVGLAFGWLLYMGDGHFHRRIAAVEFPSFGISLRHFIETLQ